MELSINGEQKRFDEDEFSVEALLEALDIEQRRGVAIAVNDGVVPRSKWSDYDLEDGDRLEIIKATQGG
ncbi:MAG: sulfur carrier protein ThiS [Myxococcota bacterium]